ncbi:MAG: phage holin family protein [Chloroflexi bacterium]|nr:phage holin family protein [Chloroflexota bacterium]
MHKFLVRLLVNAAALIVASRLLSGIQFGGWRDLLLTALVFGLVNAFIRPVVRFATCLISAATLGLFTLIVNALMLLLTAAIAERVGISFTIAGFQDLAVLLRNGTLGQGNVGISYAIAGFWNAFLGALVISVVSFVLTKIIR